MSKHVKILRRMDAEGGLGFYNHDRIRAAADELERTEKKLRVAMKALRDIEKDRVPHWAGYALKEIATIGRKRKARK